MPERIRSRSSRDPSLEPGCEWLVKAVWRFGGGPKPVPGQVGGDSVLNTSSASVRKRTLTCRISQAMRGWNRRSTGWGYEAMVPPNPDLNVSTPPSVESGAAPPAPAGPASNVRTVYVYPTRDDDLLGLVTTRKIRQFPIEFGRGSLAETFHDPEFAAYGLRFFRSIGYRGFGTIEFKRDDRDGKLKVTDLNLRWVKPINLPMAAGVDFPLIHYRDLAGQVPGPVLEFKAGVRWLDAIGDLSTSWSMYRAGELSPVAWARSLLPVRSFPAFAPDDLKPFLLEYAYGKRLLRAPLNRLRRR